MLTFDADSLRRRIRSLDKLRRFLFALACAERVFGPYRYYSRQSHRGCPHLLRSTLNNLWELAIERRIGNREPFLDEGERLIPLSVMQADEETEEAALYKEPHKLDFIADDGVCALLYACRCELRGDIESALWAAQRDYELVCSIAINLDKHAKRKINRILAKRPDLSESDLLVQVDYVQEELQQQMADLQDLTRLQGGENYPQLVKRLRVRAQRRARALQSLLRTLTD